MLPHTTTAAVLALLLGATAVAQDPPRRGGRRPAPASQEAKPAPEKPAEKAEEKPAKPEPKPIALTNATVWVGDGRKLSRATVLLKGDKIEAVGVDVEVPEGAETRDLEGLHVCPGFLMLGARGMGSNTPGQGETFEDARDPFDKTIERGLAVGITSIVAEADAGSAMPGGRAGVLKLIPGELEGGVVEEKAWYTMRVPLGPEGWRKLEEAVEKARKYEDEKAEYEKKKAAGDDKAKAPKEDKALEALREVMSGDVPLLVRGSGAQAGGMWGRQQSALPLKQCREALRIARLIGHGVILENPYEGWAIADEIAATGSSAILVPRFEVPVDETREEPNGSRFDLPGAFAKAGIVFFPTVPPGGFGGGPYIGDGGLLGRDFNTPTYDACFAVRGGLPEELGLCTLTSWPAKMLGLDDRLGTLEAGKDADLLILDGDPLGYKTLVKEAIVGGKVRYRKDRSQIFKSVGR
ncbi:MAG: amidohydrolase family protein [Planctomycetota bacterium]